MAAGAGGDYQITARFPAGDARPVRLSFGELDAVKDVGRGAAECVFGPVRLDEGTAGRLMVRVGAGEEAVGAHYVEVKRVN